VSSHIAAMLEQAPNKSALVEQALSVFWTSEPDAVQVTLQTPTGEFVLNLSVSNAHDIAEQIIAQLQKLEA
jgi:outer membrane biogenesis lipoprotein LolB